jgi:predicted DCC family thiol-disulfide oxidoreductase YuxK
METEKNLSILFYDGHCAVCDRWVQFVLKRNAKSGICFAPLQGETAKKYFEKPDFTTVAFLEKGVVYLRSDAVLRVLMALGGAWKVFSLCFILPRPIRDFAYRLFARFRYQIFGKVELCRLASQEEKKYFLP